MTIQLPPIAPETMRTLLSPALLVFRERVISNIDQMIRMAGSPERLRPHCKTHKMPAVARLLLERGVTRHKAATVAEVEMLAAAGVPDVLLAYNPVGPNIDRVVALQRQFPDCQISVTADHSVPLQALAEAAVTAGTTVAVFIDINVGMDRTGVPPESDTAFALAQQINQISGVSLSGLHVYDGHVRDPDLAERRTAVQKNWRRVRDFCQRCEKSGIKIARLICGGTPTFPVYCEFEDPDIELSPGTSVFFDVGYGSTFPDLPFEPAAAVLTRVVSCPGRNQITLDLGTKAVASDPPKGSRVVFPDLPDAVQIGHNEEHMQLQVADNSGFQPGDSLLAIPMHVCPTSALYDRVPVIDNGCVVEEWEVTGRHRVLTI